MAAGRINNSIHLGTRPKTFKALIGNETGRRSRDNNGGKEPQNRIERIYEWTYNSSERYKGLHDRLSAIELRLQKMNEDMGVSHKSQTKTIIATAGTVVAGLLSTVVVILMKMPG